METRPALPVAPGRADNYGLAEAKAAFRSLTEAIDTTTPAGRMMMQMVGPFAAFQRAMLRERTKAGLDAGRRDGRIGGRPPKLSPQQQTEIVRMISRGGKTGADAARLFGVHPATISRLIRARNTDGAGQASSLCVRLLDAKEHPDIPFERYADDAICHGTRLRRGNWLKNSSGRVV